ncbi:MAG: peptidase, partial [Caulobacteraceae bacterium]|nr:peptidase [Caulobacteraceae bacterium]
LTLLCLLSASAACAAPASTPAAPPAAGIESKRLSQHVKVVSGDDYEGRGPATAGEKKTIAYLISRMKAEGLQPGGDMGRDGKRAWTQATPLRRFEIKGPVKASFTSAGQTQAVTQGNEVSLRAAQTNVDRVSIKDAPVVFAGYGVAAPERKWDDFKGMDLKGKVVLVLVNDPDFETGPNFKNGGDFGGKAMTYYGRWTYKYEEAARRGAAGLLVIHETAPAAYGWATVKNSNTNAQFDIVRARPSEAHPLLEGWIQRDETVDLFKKAGLDFEALKKKAQTRDFQPVVLKGTTFSTDFAVDHTVITSYNVLGLLPGTKRPDETVIYTAHWDHLGVGNPDARGDRIYNGAVDNGTGVAALLELGRVFAKAPRADRSVVFMSVTAEEKGLLGSLYYAAHPLYPLAKTVANLNMDMLDVYGRTRNMSTSGSGQTDLQDTLARYLKAEGRYYSPDQEPEAGHFYRSDHFSFAKVGVPAISIRSGDDLIKGGAAAGKAAKAAYVKDRYHQPADEWSADWDLSGQVQDLELIYRLGRDLANSDRWPSWTPGSEFKATRDRTAALRK